MFGFYIIHSAMVTNIHCVLFTSFPDGPVTNMCPPRTDQTKVDAIRTETTEIEVKPPETCLTHSLQVISKHY